MKKQAITNEEDKKSNVAEKINVVKITDRATAAKAIFYVLFGFVTGFFPESYIVSPFAYAAVASAESSFAVFAFAGACLGYIIGRGFVTGVRYIVTLCFVLASRAVSHKRFLSLDKTMISAVFVTIFTALSDALDMITVRVSATGVILCLADSLLGACSVYFFSRSLSAPVMRLGIRKISNYDAVCLCVTVAVLLCCVGKINVMGFYVFHIPACLLIMFCAFYAKAAGGSIAGTLLGIVLSFGCEMPSLFYMYAAGGLIAGAFAFHGQYICAAAFAVASGAAAFFSEGEAGIIPAVVECVISSAVFMLLPSVWLRGAEEYLSRSGLRNDNEINMQVALSLKDAARTVDSISDVVCQVSKKMNTVVSPEVSRTFARIQHNVCADCEKKSVCWNECFDSTVRDIQQIAKMRLSSQKVREENLTGAITSRCRKIRKLSDEIDKDYKQYTSAMDSRLKIDEMRNVVSDQFSSMAQLLYDVSAFIEDEKVYDEIKSAALKRSLRENRIEAVSAAYRENSLSRATVEIILSEEPDRVDCEKIRKIISAALNKKFKEAEMSIEDFSTVLIFRQKSEYEVSVGMKQIPLCDSGVCGDCAESFDTAEGCTVAVISDGMGTGKRAALDSAMTSTIMNRLLSSGFTFKSALRLVNSALLIRSGEESLSTVDALSFNTYSAECTFYKAGAAASYVRQGKKILSFEKPSLPVGILRDIDFAEEKCRVSDGDIIMMMSDGVCGGDEEWIAETLRCWSTDNMHELATYVAERARLRNEKTSPDDITVVAIKVKKR